MKNLITVFLLMATTGLVQSQNTISFRVNEKTGEPLIGASVVIEGTTIGTITNVDGIAMLENIPNGKIEFLISFIGYEEKEIALSFPENNDKVVEIELLE